MLQFPEHFNLLVLDTIADDGNCDFSNFLVEHLEWLLFDFTHFSLFNGKIKIQNLQS